jgi:hypothetical protein
MLKILNKILADQIDPNAVLTKLNEIEQGITDIRESVAGLDPFRQTIKTATATVEVMIASADVINSHYMDSGGI